MKERVVWRFIKCFVSTSYFSVEPMTHSNFRLLCVAVVVLSTQSVLFGGDWPRFRGPNGSGIAADSDKLPSEWSDTKNLQWKAELPGPGSSCPIVVGERVFLTSWSGYSAGGETGSLEDLKRHLVCINRKTGKEEWRSTVKAKLPEDSYRGMFAENGYATHTPVSDGEVVVAFFGKSGVYAYDMTGKELWNAQVGEGRDRKGWGSSSSPIIYENFVIVTASPESRTIVAFEKTTGEEVWKTQADGVASTWGTPILVTTKERPELILAVPYEVWSLHPATGKLLWYCEAIGSSSMCSSLVEHDGIVYGMESGPGGGGAAAIKIGGTGDVSDTHIVWSENHRSRIGSPLYRDGILYYVNSGVLYSIDAESGKRLSQLRLEGSASSGSRSGGRSGRGGSEYSSAVIADGKLFYARRSGDVCVVKLGETVEQIATNRFASASGDFHATPAISDGQLFIRASNMLYCVALEE